MVLIATGSEVQYAVAAADTLAGRGIARARGLDALLGLFEEEPAEYRDDVLAAERAARVGIETGISLGWHRWVGPRGGILSIDRFGASAPGPEVTRRLGFTAEHVVTAALEVLG